MTSLLQVIALVMFLAVPAVGDDPPSTFLEDFPDVPLMPGFSERSASRMVFDKAEGRILETHLFGMAQVSEAVAFYQDSLTELGWSRAGVEEQSHYYVRESDALSLRFEPRKNRLEIIVFLQPRADLVRN